MLWFKWSSFILLFPSPPVTVPILWWLYRAHQLQLISPSISFSIGFSVLQQSLRTYLSFRFLSVLSCGQPERQRQLFGRFSFSFLFFLFLMIKRSCRLAEIRWSICISKSQRILCVSFHRTNSGLCINYLFVWSNINFLHNPTGLPSLSSRV